LHTALFAVLFVAALFTIAKNEPKCPSLDEWINKMCYTHTTEYQKGINFDTLQHG
jgi:hypothetical protein